MKKLIALAALAACLPSFAGTVESSNTVGYTKVSLSADTYFISGAQFVQIGGAAATLSDLFPAGDIPFGTEILIQDENAQYNHFKYLAEAYDVANDDFVAGWADGFEELVVDSTPIGKGFWLLCPEDYDICQIGEVENDGSVTITIPQNQYTLVINPFPAGFNPNSEKVTWSGNLPYNTEILAMDENNQYNHYKYLDEAYDVANDDFVAGWGDGFEELVTGPITSVPGQGFWVISPETITLTISK